MTPDPARRRAAPGLPGPRRAAAAALIVCAIWSAAGCAAPPAPASPRGSIDGLTYSRFVGSTLAQRLRAEQVLFLPQRLGIFQVSAMTEVVLTRVRLEVFDDVRASSPGSASQLRPARVLLPGLTGARHVSGATLYDIDCVIVRDGRSFVRIRAARGRADGFGGEVALREVRVEGPSTGRTLTAARAVWRPQASELVVRGEYTLREAGRVTTGRGIRLDADMEARGL